MARACDRPVSSKLRCVLQSPILKLSGSPYPGAMACRMKTTLPLIFLMAADNTSSVAQLATGNAQSNASSRRRTGLIIKANIAYKVFVVLATGLHVVCHEAIVGVAHGNANHNDLIIRDLRMRAHHMRLHDALAIDDAA